MRCLTVPQTARKCEREEEQLSTTTTEATESESKYLAYDAAGRYCGGLSRWTLLRAWKAGYLRRCGSPASPRFKTGDLDAWMESGAPTAPVSDK